MSRTKCPECLANRSLAVYPDGTYCFACQKRESDRSLVSLDNTNTIQTKLEDVSLIDRLPDKAIRWLAQYHITINPENDSGLFMWSDSHNRLAVTHYRYYEGLPVLMHVWLRDIDGRTPKWLFVGDKTIPHYRSTGNINNVPIRNKLVVTEDCLSAWRCYPYADVLSLGGTNVNKKEFLPILLKYKKLIVWTDGDDAGRKASHEFAMKYRIFRDVREIRTRKDPKEFFDREIKEILDRGL